jgi:hypothetical protein
VGVSLQHPGGGVAGDRHDRLIVDSGGDHAACADHTRKLASRYAGKRRRQVESTVRSWRRLRLRDAHDRKVAVPAVHRRRERGKAGVEPRSAGRLVGVCQ